MSGQGPPHAHYPELANIRFYADAVDEFNAEARTCARAAHAQPRFPAELMGWRRYAQYVELANRARARHREGRASRSRRSSARRRSTCSRTRATRGARTTIIPSASRAPIRCRTSAATACAQPFFLVSEADQVLIQMAGAGGSSSTVDPRDDARAPATPCTSRRACRAAWFRDGENVQIRLKAEPAVREAVAWYCACGELVHSLEIRRRASSRPRTGGGRRPSTRAREPARAAARCIRPPSSATPRGIKSQRRCVRPRVSVMACAARY